METYSARLAEELAKRGPVDLITLPGRPSGRVPTTLALIIFGIRTAARLLTASNARVLHIGDLATWPLAWIASLRHPHSRVVMSAHGSDVSFADQRGWRSALYHHYLRAGAALLRSAHIIANSEYVAGLAEKAGFRRISVVPLATDLTCGPAAERAHLLYAGRISRAKGLRFIIEAVLPLLPEGTRLRVAGVVCEETERPLISHPSVDYLGVLSPESLAFEYARAAVVVIPTRDSEGFGLVAIEAAACGAYVVASHHSGLVDVVRLPIGVTVDSGSPQAWASAIEEALSTPAEEAAIRSLDARCEVDRNYRWPRVANATWAIYEQA